MIEALRETMTQNAPVVLALGGLLLGFVFGAVVFRTNFCAMGSLSDIHNFGDYRRFRAWVLAAATALAGAQILHLAGIAGLEKSMYLAAANLNWFGHVAGGLIFGFGMVYAGGCPSRNLARAGGGDLRALMTLVVLGLLAYVAMRGLLAPIRARLEQVTSFALLTGRPAALADLAHVVFGGTARASRVIVTVLLVGGALWYCFSDAAFRTSWPHVVSGLAIGAVVSAGWALTGLAYDDFATRPAAPISLTYIRPVGDTLQWLALFTADPVPGFGVASVLGALAGAFAAAWHMGRFRLSTFSDTSDTLRNLLGAALMGIGGVMALGCTVGQAITGVSTLALGSFLTFAAIVAGGLYGLRVLERQILAAA